jgi:hypothetical protein
MYEDPEFLKRMVDKANGNECLMDGTTRPVKKIIAEADIVLGIWQDQSKPRGIGYLFIKGADLLADVVAMGAPATYRWNAIKCVEAAQAEAARLMFGTKLN